MDKVDYLPKYENSWALVIGINKYLYAPPLGYACNDAEAIASILKGKYAFPEQNVRLLLDKEATRDAILSAYLEYASEGFGVDSNDRILFFFAGHGHTVEGNRGETGYLVPVDGKVGKPASLLRWDEFVRNADLIPAKHMLFVMDACYGGLVINRGLKPGSMRFLKDMLKRYSRQALTAGKADEVVADAGGPLKGHSVFTGHLIQALEGAAASEEGIITANGVMAYVYEMVGRDYQSFQTPHFGFLDGDGDFIFEAPPLTGLIDEDGTKVDMLVEVSVPSISGAPPKGGESAVGVVKKYIADPFSRVNLHDYVVEKTRGALGQLTTEKFPLSGVEATKENFAVRLRDYELAIAEMQSIVTILSYWGDTQHTPLIEKVIARLAEPNELASGMQLWINLRWYPIMLLIYSGGIAAIAASRHENLVPLLKTKIGSSHTREVSKPVMLSLGSALAGLHEVFKWLPQHERLYTPRSEYLFKLLQPRLEDLLFLGRDYEDLFDRFEVMLALIHADEREGWSVWGPVGRFGWKQSRGESSPLNQIYKEAQTFGDEWTPLKTGFFGGSFQRFEEIWKEYSKQVNGLGWY